MRSTFRVRHRFNISQQIIIYTKHIFKLQTPLQFFLYFYNLRDLLLGQGAYYTLNGELQRSLYFKKQLVHPIIYSSRKKHTRAMNFPLVI